MGGTKIFVLQLRELVKSSIFIVIGIVLLVMLVFFFIPKDNIKKPADEQRTAINLASNAVFVPGTYTTEILLHNSPIKVNVTVTEDKIVSVEFKDSVGLANNLYPLFTSTMETIAGDIVKNQSAEAVRNADNSMTSQVLIDAVRVSLQKAVSKA